jgi:hypothetical protein
MRLCLAALCFTGLAGCGGPSVKVEGQLVADGKPVAAGESNPLTITLAQKMPPDSKEAGKSFSAVVDASGHFAFDAGGIPPGTYRVSLLSTAQGPTAPKPPPWVVALSSTSTTLTHDVTNDPNQRIVVDGVKRTVHKE